MQSYIKIIDFHGEVQNFLSRTKFIVYLVILNFFLNPNKITDLWSEF